LSSTTSPKWRRRSRGPERPAISARNWSPMSMNAELLLDGPRKVSSKNLP
jgi:hypothetical protein